MKFNNFFKSKSPESSLFWGYLSYVIIGVILLSMPWSRKVEVSVLDNLFISVSAISTTGLTTVSTFDSYNILGQLVIIILIQLGGIGYMTFGSFIVLSTRQILSEDREIIHKTAFSLPKDFSIKKFIRSIVVYTIVIETIGAILLIFAFWNDNRTNVIWSAIFHSISSFCTAGFSLYNNSFELYANNIFLNVVIFILSFLGAIGYIVMVDFWLLLRGKKDNITFTSKIILATTIWLLILGAIFIFLEDSIKKGFYTSNLLPSIFQSMTALTTVGFNTIPIGGLSSSILFIIIILMIIGASPSGTGGGIKSTTVSSLFGIISSLFSRHKEYVNYKHNEIDITKSHEMHKSRIKFFDIFSFRESKSNEIDKRNNELNVIFGDIFKIKLLNRTIPFDRVIHAVATFTFYFTILFFGILLLLTTDKFSFEQIFFEAASALGTVGLSTGITGSLSVLGKIIIIILMFIGRLGPITFGVVIFNKKIKANNNEYEDIVI